MSEMRGSHSDVVVVILKKPSIVPLRQVVDRSEARNLGLRRAST